MHFQFTSFVLFVLLWSILSCFNVKSLSAISSNNFEQAATNLNNLSSFCNSFCELFWHASPFWKGNHYNFLWLTGSFNYSYGAERDECAFIARTAHNSPEPKIIIAHQVTSKADILFPFSSIGTTGRSSHNSTMEKLISIQCNNKACYCCHRVPAAIRTTSLPTSESRKIEWHATQ